MWKLIGIISLLGGTAGVLHGWISEQKEEQKQLEEFILFLQKSVYVMQNEKIKVMSYFERYIEKQDNKKMLLLCALEEIIKKLSTNTYPNGQMVWEEVFLKKGREIQIDRETIQIIVQAGNGFFGYSREENIYFLEKSLRELELQQAKIKAKNTQERKVWIPVGMLSSVMVVILLL